MRNDSLKISLCIKDDPIRSRTAPGIDPLIAQYRKLIVRRRIGERDVLVVFVLVRIPVPADGLVVGVVGVALLDGSRDVGGSVAGGAAG